MRERELAHMTLSIFPVTFMVGVYAVLPPQPTSYCNIVLWLQIASALSHTGENLLQSAFLPCLECNAFFWQQRGKVIRQNLPSSFRKFQQRAKCFVFKNSQ